MDGHLLCHFHCLQVNCLQVYSRRGLNRWMIIYCLIFIVYRFTVAGLLASRPKSMDDHLLSHFHCLQIHCCRFIRVEA